ASAAAHAATREISADDLASSASHLGQRPDRSPLRPSTRNPFQFARPLVSPHRASVQPVAAIIPAQPAAPVLTLMGITEQKHGSELMRTAIISGEGQLYLAATGDVVGGRD